jgi:hypothetical protein
MIFTRFLLLSGKEEWFEFRSAGFSLRVFVIANRYSKPTG